MDKYVFRKDLNKSEGTKHSRNSNLELLRIIAMLLIVAHHFVVNSCVVDQFDFLSISANMLYLQIFGMWGKTAINVFVLISGYFLCEIAMTWQRWLKIYLQWKGYRIFIFIVFCLLGYEELSVINIIKLVFDVVRGINNGFVGSFLFFYAFIPFFNLLLKRLSKRDHQMFIVLMLFFVTFFGTFVDAESVFVESIWYMDLYFIAAYLKKYEPKWSQDFKLALIGLVTCITLAILSVVILDFGGAKLGVYGFAYYLVSDSNKILSLLVGIFTFLTFKNMNPRENKVINTIASTVFGVLCIHASSDAMRKFLWNDVVNVPKANMFSFGKLVAYSIGVVCIIFAVCSIIDFIRLRLIEKPLFKLINSKTGEWKTDDRNVIKRLLSSYNSIGIE